MKPKTKAESYWRYWGYEARHAFKQGPGAAKKARNFTRLQCNRAMRVHGKQQIREQLNAK